MQPFKAERKPEITTYASYQVQHPQNWGEMGIVLALFRSWKQRAEIPGGGKEDLITNLPLKEIKILNCPRA